MSSDSESLASAFVGKEQMREILKENKILHEIRDVEIILPKGGGDNFASTTASVNVSFVENVPPVGMFIKRKVKNSEFAGILNEIQMFEKEAAFFNTLVPDLTKFCEQKPGYDGFLEGVFPKCYHASEEMILLENLVLEGYTILDKTISHTVEGARQVLDKLARMHGATYAFANELTQDVFKQKYPFVWEVSVWAPSAEKWNAVWTQMVVDGAIKILKACPTEGSERALEYIQQYEHEAYFKSCDEYDLKHPSCGIVVNHGDCWNSNIMFKLKPESTEFDQSVLIDLQTIHLGSPVLDMQFYLLMSMDAKVVYPNLKPLLRYYYEQFVSYVNKLGGKVDFSYEDLYDDFRRKCTMGFFYGFYSIFGFEMHAAVDDVNKIEGDVSSHLGKTMDYVVTKNIPTKGIQYSEKIVYAFNEFYKVRNDIV